MSLKMIDDYTPLNQEWLFKLQNWVRETKKMFWVILHSHVLQSTMMILEWTVPLSLFLHFIADIWTLFFCEQSSSRLCIHQFSGRLQSELVLRRNASAPPLHRHGELLFPYHYSPSLDFQHHHAHHYRCQKLCAEYELSLMGWGGGRRGVVTRKCRRFKLSPAGGEVRTPLHPGGPP